MSQIEGMDSTAEARTGWVLDNFPKSHSEMAVLEKAAILPDLIICLVDSSGHHGKCMILVFVMPTFYFMTCLSFFHFIIYCTMQY